MTVHVPIVGYGYDEIGALPGASSTNVNKHLARARAPVRNERVAA